MKETNNNKRLGIIMVLLIGVMIVAIIFLIIELDKSENLRFQNRLEKECDKQGLEFYGYDNPRLTCIDKSTLIKYNLFRPKLN